MPNTLLTPTMITREGLRILHNNLVFVKGVNRQYSSEFAVSGAKIGSVINVRKPNRYNVRTGPAMIVQNTAETSVPLALTRQWGVDVNFTSAELTLSLDDFSKRILTPAMAKIASQIDYEGLALFASVWNQVGTPGTTPGTGAVIGPPTTILDTNTVRPVLNAGLMLDLNAAPRDENRRVVLHPAAMAGMASGLSGLFQDQTLIAEQYRKGVLGTALGFEFALDQNVNNLTCGTRAGTPVVDGNNQTGSTLNIRGVTAGTTLAAGEIIDIVSVNGVNPENQQLWNLPMTAAHGNIYFVCTALTTADVNGRMAIPISPSIKLAAVGVADGTVNALPVDGAVINWDSGTLSTTYPISLAYHQDAFTLATADLELPQGVDFAARETYDGISMRIVRAFDITNDQFPCRIDVLGGWAALRPEMACRITG
jgi:P22 coat protein - gene protein 5